ncbi:Sir2 histone deacetylase Hst2 [Saitozyma podzolica]|uniref:NAD-dependent protein deacetylase n=1 Tax=Saitozyma podzolica TaxID=1890683 RepID=A0A427YKA2_9TREE|nr:Sir2 histone deacetylase Hst2 [Saitozyma podzolica]
MPEPSDSPHRADPDPHRPRSPDIPDTPSSSSTSPSPTPPRPRDSSLAHIAQLISSGKAKNVVVLTGAGISTSAGIPDFRSPETGLYANLARLNLPFPEAVFELNYFRRNPKPFWTLAKDLYPGKYLPTPAHYFIRLLHDHGLLRRCFTQNIDTLESLAGLPDSHLIEAHGSFANAHCLSCQREASREYVLAAGVREGKVVRCDEKGCGGLVKPDIVFFGEGLPERFFRSIGDLKRCDLLIILGTSLQVHPFASLPSYVSANTPRLLINREAVGPFSRLASSRSSGPEGGLSKLLSAMFDADEEDEARSRDIFWGGDADDGVRRLAEELGWEEELEKVIKEGRRELEEMWRELEGEEPPEEISGEEGRERAKVEAEKVAKELKIKEEEDGIPEKPASPSLGRVEVEDLSGLVERQLHVADEHEDK